MTADEAVAAPGAETARVTDRDIWRIAAPMILSNLSVPLLGLVDTAVVGHLEYSWYLGAVAVGAAIFSFIYNGVNFLRMGTTGVAAQSFGAGDADAVRRSLFEALIVALLIAIALLALQQPIAALALELMSPEPDVLREAQVYFDIRIWSAPAAFTSFVVIGWFLGLQNARVPLAIVVVVNSINIVLDLVFVVGLGMTTAGVAGASVIAEYVGAALAVALAMRELRRWPGTLRIRELVSLGSYRAYFQVNSNILVRTLALMFALFFMTAQSARLGTTLLAANAILLNLQYVVSYALDGLAHAAEALVGKAIGARNAALLRQSVRRIMVWSAAIAVGIALVFALGGRSLIGVLTNLPAVKATATAYLAWLVLSPVISVWSFVYDGVFIGATRAREMRNVMVMAAFAVFVPAWYLTRDLGNHGLWLAFTLFMLARALGMQLYYPRIPAAIR